MCSAPSLCREQSSLSCGKHCSHDLEALFRACFYHNYHTVLSGGASEPLYLPATVEFGEHLLWYREHFFASALHETAHWCIAGEQRRSKVDFGYWYFEDGRTRVQQRAFEEAEIKPQALEWIFAVAAGAPFRVSSDNLSPGWDVLSTEGGGVSDTDGDDTFDFAEAVYRQVLSYCAQGLPCRATRFVKALVAFYGTDDPLANTRYDRQDL